MLINNNVIGVGGITGDQWTFPTKSLNLNGTDEYLDITPTLAPLVAAGNDSSINIWFKTPDESPTGSGVIWSYSDTDSNSEIRFFMKGSGLISLFVVAGGVAQWQIDTTDVPLSVNSWNMVSVSKELTDCKIRVNNVVVPQAYTNTTDKAVWFDSASMSGLDNGYVGVRNYNSGGLTIFTPLNVLNLLTVAENLSQAQWDGIYNYSKPIDESNISNGISYYRMGNYSGDNYNNDTTNAWTFIDLIGSADINTGTTSIEADVVNETYSNLLTTFDNSVVYEVSTDYIKRSTNAEFNFTTTETEMYLVASVDGLADKVGLWIDGVFDSELTLVDGVPLTVTLAGGSKSVKLMEMRINATTFNGCRLKSISLGGTNFTLERQGDVSEVIAFLVDSIMNGSNATKFTSGCAQLIRDTDSKNIKIIGYAGSTISEIATTAPQLATTNEWIEQAFVNATTTKKLVIAMGINDFLGGLPAATFNTRYNQLLDAINVADPTIEVFCISPILTTTDDAILDLYRTNMGIACGVRSWCTYIDGKPILELGDLDDGVHPTTAGQLKYHDYIDSIIL
jgi:hypothetical protein